MCAFVLGEYAAVKQQSCLIIAAAAAGLWLLSAAWRTKKRPPPVPALLDRVGLRLCAAALLAGFMLAEAALRPTPLGEGVTGLLVLFRLCQPLNLPKAGLIAAMGITFFGAAFLFGSLFSLSPLTLESWVVFGAFTVLSPLLMTALTALLRRLKLWQTKDKTLKTPKPLSLHETDRL